MKRRAFLTVCFAVSSSVMLKIWRTDCLPAYPGRIVPLDEQALKKTAKWIG